MKALVSFTVVMIIALSMRVPYVFGLDIRLIGGPDSYSGRVEVGYHGVWGTVCDDGWDIQDAEVVCRMLGFQNAVRAVGNAEYGEGSGSIFLDDVQCLGTERDLAECSHGRYGIHNCGHSEDAGAVCANDQNLQVRLVGGRTALEGRVEVFFGGSWGTVCDDLWDLNDVRVVCRMLGFQNAVRAVMSAEYGVGSGSIILDDVQCLGTEHNIAECPHNGYESHDCQHIEDAGAVCANEDTTSQHFGVRLVGGRSRNEGRVEMFYNLFWVTICDVGWGLREADVVCRMLGFTGALEVLNNVAFGEGIGISVLVRSISCLGSENSLLACSFTVASFELNSCPHSQDLSVKCNDAGALISTTQFDPTTSLGHPEHVSQVLGAILAGSYTLFLLVGLYGCYRLRKLERTEAASGYLNPTIGGERVYTEMSFTKGNDQEGPSRKYKAPIKQPIGRKPKSGRLGSPDRNDPSPLTLHDPIYDECD
eukprot:XP_011673757.1 PREDICTED: deleted in malignant brain tumors 1 protein-like [Strongylocentrotus purpuratus]